MTIDQFKAKVRRLYPNAKISWTYLNGCPSSYVARVKTETGRLAVTIKDLK